MADFLTSNRVRWASRLFILLIVVGMHAMAGWLLMRPSRVGAPDGGAYTEVVLDFSVDSSVGNATEEIISESAELPTEDSSTQPESVPEPLAESEPEPEPEPEPET